MSVVDEGDGSLTMVMHWTYNYAAEPTKRNWRSRTPI